MTLSVVVVSESGSTYDFKAGVVSRFSDKMGYELNISIRDRNSKAAAIE